MLLFVVVSTSMQVTVAALGIVICYADRSNMSTAILPMAEAFHWDKVGQTSQAAAIITSSDS